MDFVKGLAGRASDTVSEVKTSVENTSFMQELASLKQRLQQQAEEWKNEKVKLIEEFAEEKKNLLRNAIQSRLEGIFDHGMNVANALVKEKIKDPYMPECVKDIVDEAVDGIWPDLKSEVKEAVLAGVMGRPIIAHGEPPCCCMGQLLAWFRYSLCPYDRSIWRMMRHPFWWLYNLLSLVPKFQISSMVYIWWFLIMDKGDEFQLYSFIAEFKALQFLTLGVLSSFVGSVQYYVCTTSTPNNCDWYAPREDVWTSFVFCVQVAVLYAAFFMMSCSKKKGGFFHQVDEESRRLMQSDTLTPEARVAALKQLTGGERDKVASSMRFRSEEDLLKQTRGHLNGFFIYDVICFLLCLGLCIWMAFANLLDPSTSVEKNPNTVSDANANWKFKASLFWIKALYGVLSLPFVILKLPFYSTFMCHARPTGYNPYGNTVPYVKVEEDGPVPWDPNRAIGQTSPV